MRSFTPTSLAPDLPTPFITVVMPVRNEARFIGDTLTHILNQEYPTDRFEVIVADGMSDDGTPGVVREIAARHCQVRLLDNPERRSSSGRNVGFRNGKGDLFLVVDGHCHIPDRKLLWNLVEAFRKSGADCLGRPQPLDPPGLTAFQKAVAVARGSWLGHSGDSLIYSGYEGFCSPVSNGAAYRRGVFDKVGSVDETFDAAEDVEFNYRVEKTGMRCYTSPVLEVKYYPRENIPGLVRQMVRYGIGRARFIRKHPEALSLNTMIPPAFLLGVVCGVLAFLGWWAVSGWVGEALGWVAAIEAVCVCLYIVMILVESMRLSLRHGLSQMMHLPIIFLAIHTGLGWGYLVEVVIPVSAG